MLFSGSNMLDLKLAYKRTNEDIFLMYSMILVQPVFALLEWLFLLLEQGPISVIHTQKPFYLAEAHHDKLC